MQTCVNNLPFRPMSSSEASHRTPKFLGPQFGCRLMAFMTEESEPSNMAGDLLTQATLKNPNCIKNQS
ncbi:MAG: hypothetical protein K2X66_15745, partial [Cyanobacteria bacterium]|nr:hypothetical protein [Cyanobacteriota bacterium]